MRIENQEYYSISDSRLFDVFGMGETKEDALKNYCKSLKKEKDKRLNDLKTIEVLENEIAELMKSELNE